MLHNVLYGALELGLEPWFQQYTHHPTPIGPGWPWWDAITSSGSGRLVPWVEWVGAAGGTDLKVPEIRSRFAFMTDVGVGASVFLTDRTALYIGYRLQHVSNGNTSSPNYGFESHTGVIGATFFLK